jgi:P2-related tail formation protein
MRILIFDLLVILDNRHPFQFVIHLGLLWPQIQQGGVQNLIFLIHEINSGNRRLPLSLIDNQTLYDQI